MWRKRRLHYDSMNFFSSSLCCQAWGKMRSSWGNIRHIKETVFSSSLSHMYKTNPQKLRADDCPQSLLCAMTLAWRIESQMIEIRLLMQRMSSVKPRCSICSHWWKQDGKCASLSWWAHSLDTLCIFLFETTHGPDWHGDQCRQIAIFLVTMSLI